MKDTPIFITGAPRSGKTLVAGVLKICGVFSGATDTMLENIHVRDQFLARYLKEHGADPKGCHPIIPPGEFPIPMGWAEKVDNVMIREGYDRGPWMLKTHKLALTWPVWHGAYAGAKWIIVRRRTGDIVESCLKTHYMTAYSKREGWVEMVRQYEERFVEMIMEGLDCKVIWPQRMVYGDYSQVYELLDWLGLPWSTEILAYIDPKFWRTRNKKNKTA